MTIAWEGEARRPTGTSEAANQAMEQAQDSHPEILYSKEFEQRPIGQLQTAKHALEFILAGNAYFTLRSKKTGARYTYRVSKPKPEDKDGGRLGTKWFVALLAGPENTSDYVYLGMITAGAFRLTKASKMSITTTPVKAIAWTLQVLSAGRLPDDLEIWHSGRCGKCGRVLTVPESVERGIGPECASQMGL